MQSYHETSAAISAVANWREIAATLAIFAALAALIAWQVKGTPEKCRNWLASSAMSLEALAMAMAVFWAIQQGAGILSVFFAAGFVGLALSKAVTISALVQAHREHKHGAFFVAMLALLGAYFTVYGAGVFEGTLHSAGEHEQAAMKSAPVTAIDAQLQAARGRLESLAGYADAGKADAEISQAKADAAQAQGRISELQARISDALQAVPLNSQGKPAGRSLGALSQNCAESYSGHYSGACGAVRDMRREMSALAGSGGTGDYARGHSEYSGMRAHIAELETRRAELLAGGASTGTAAGADDRLVSWVFGLENIQNAAGLKWLLLVAIFDFLSLALRLSGELLLGRDIAGEYARKLAALINAGLSPDAAAAAVSGNTETIPPAQVSKPHLASADTGARIHSDGLLHVHSGEAVLNAAAVAALERQQPGLIDRLNALQANDLNKPMTTQGNDYKPMTKGNGLQVIKCESCGAEVKQRTVWQRFCPTCSAERKRGVLRAKAKTVKKS